ncbi:MAG TPA: hypothetical protein VNU19_13245 [Candidatus Acidoferrum sp.]|nr:hypothetical protein [Candidatus Acidoferrum sp.]
MGRPSRLVSLVAGRFRQLVTDVTDALGETLHLRSLGHCKATDRCTGDKPDGQHAEQRPQAA